MKGFQVRISQTTSNHATANLQPGEIPGGGNMVKGIIYDMDDLMVDSYPLHVEASMVLFKEYGCNFDDLTDDLKASFVGMRVKDILKEMIKAFGLDIDIEALYAKRTEIFLKLVKEKLEAMPGLLESLHLFKRHSFKIALASSGTKEYINVVLEKFKIANYFCVIVSGDDVKIGKPDPETYLVATKKLGLRPEQCIVLEDATVGIESAKSAGCKCIAIPAPNTPPQNHSKADLVLGSLNEITIKAIKAIR